MIKNRYYFSNSQKTVVVDAVLKSLVKKACDKTLLAEEFGCPAEISITFTDNAGIKAINTEERGIDKETDVLSFPLIGDEESPDILPDGYAPLGDIVISLEKAISQAEEYGHSYEREVAFLCVHSVLHLLGYDHINEKEEKEMIAKQEAVLTSLGITRK